MRYLIPILLMFLSGGCGLELLAGTAIQGTLQKEALSGAKQTLDYTKDSSARMTLEQAINAYAAENGTYPASLEALVPEWLPSIPVQADGTAFGYDPATGALYAVFPAADGAAPQSAPPPGLLDTQPLQESNQERLIRIHEAISRYTIEQRKYPESLQALVPQYLTQTIKTRDGQDFTYDPATGIVSTPPPLPQPLGAPAPTAASPGAYGQVPPAPSRTPAGAGGPMGEALTGIGIQNQLNRSLSGGGASSAARQHLRSRSGEAVGQHNLQQEEALRELDQ
ncbi:MAG TPA: hypothetical protein PKK44_16090 [Candidatus Hydrogenedentes bacterium]|nr:hypothetical protein [Candidatus Hydrogenedentota bacterium]